MGRQSGALLKLVRDRCHTGNLIQGNRETMATPSMKPITEKPPEQIMRFFTPDLYLRFNSPDDAVADSANAEWDQAIERYERHLATFKDQLPSQVRKLTELSLHDSEVLARGEEFQPSDSLILPKDHFSQVIPAWTALAIVTVKDGRRIRSLIYCLWDHIRSQSNEGNWPFSKEREHWLYDEVEVVSRKRVSVLQGAFLHRILLSTGIVLEIPFTSVIIHEFTLAKIEEEVGR
jgi:hypothetical protein